jgi:hypothetical protein
MLLKVVQCQSLWNLPKQEHSADLDTLWLPTHQCHVLLWQHAQKLLERKEHAYKEAVAVYKAEHSASLGPKHKRPRSLRDIVNQFGNIINLTTLSRQVKDLPSAREVGRSHTKLKTKEEMVLVKHTAWR